MLGAQRQEFFHWESERVECLETVQPPAKILLSMSRRIRHFLQQKYAIIAVRFRLSPIAGQAQLNWTQVKAERKPTLTNVEIPPRCRSNICL